MTDYQTYMVDGKVVSKEEFDRRVSARYQQSISLRDRPFIDLNDKGVFTHNGDKCRVVLRRGKISVGCSDVSPEALKELVRLWDDTYPASPSVVVVQDL